MTRRRALGAALLFAAMTAGCGGVDDEGGGTPASGSTSRSPSP
ncbi:MAG TPA: hypothetical protein VH395_01930 [Jatrophihabitantaceae bacterium]|jgi:hypothetical protein